MESRLGRDRSVNRTKKRCKESESNIYVKKTIKNHRPLDNKILKLIDFKKLDALLEGFKQSTGFGTAILDLDGNILAKSEWRQMCTKFHRIHPGTSKKCSVSDTVLASQLSADKKYHLYRCLNGLVDVAMPIIIQEEHVANLFLGQFFSEKPDECFFKEQAKKYGFDEKSYLEALREVPIISEAKVKVAVKLLLNITLFISEMASQKLEQIATNEELRTSEERYRLVLDNSMDAILLTTTDEVIFSANQAACTIFQRSEEEICRVGKNGIVDTTDPRLPIFMEEWKRTGKAKGELLMLRSDGTKFHADLSSSIYSDQSGQQKTSIIIRDITERKLAEEALRENEKRYRLISDVVSDYIFTTKIDKNGKLELSWVTGAFEKITGYSIEEYIAHGGWRATIHPDDLEKDNHDFEKLKKNNKLVSDIRTFAKDGRIVWVRVYAHPVLNHHKELVGIYGGVKDITESKLIENALAVSEARLHTLVQTIPDLIWLKDINGVYLSCNTVFERFYGAKEADIIGKTDYDFIDCEVADSFRENDLKAIALGKPCINEEWITFANDGHTALIETTKTPMYNSSGKLLGVLGIGHDITERKQIEVALNKSEEELRKFASHLQNVREEEKVALAREIHDDLGQIFVALKIDIGLLKQKVVKDSSFASSAEMLEKLDNLVFMIDKTIKTTRRIMTGLRPEQLEILGFIGAANAYLQQFEERHQLRCQFIVEAPDIDLNQQQALTLFRILQEALNNIVKHAKASMVKIQLSNKTDTLIMEIIDNGIGFDQNNSGRTDSYGMIGMKERVVLLEGKLEIISEVGNGTCVRVEIPYLNKYKQENYILKEMS